MAILSFCSVTKNAPVKKNFTGAPPVHRWCGEIVKYLTLGCALPPLSLQNNRFIANELRESSEGAQSDTAITLPLHERFASPKQARKFMRQT